MKAEVYTTKNSAIKVVSVKIPRLHALDAMRGIFCLVVIFGHFFLTAPHELQTRFSWLALTPLRFGWAFLVVFYMLSGFVLALPYGMPKPPVTAQFLIKRLSRLYIPYAAIIIIAFLFYILTGTSPAAINNMTFHIESLTSPGSFTLSMLGRVLLMTGLREDLLLDPATWTLVQEVRISLLFPLLIILCRRSWVGFTVIALCYVTVYLAQNSIGHYVVFSGLTDDYPTTWMTTLYITPCFMCGIFLAKYRSRILKFMSRLATGWRMALWIWVAINFSFMTDFEIRQPFTELAAAPLIMLVLSSETASVIAENFILQWLGKHSYSIYLVHLPLLFILRNQLHDKLGLGWILILCFIMTFPIAILAHRLIERPARLLAKKWVSSIP